MQAGKKIYFISDLHLGAPTPEASLVREKRFVNWLDEISHDAEELFVVGDLFDFWFEYKRAVPRGFVRCLGKLAELSDKGIKISVFTGNHDMWIFDYLPSEIGCTLYREPITRVWNGKKFYIGHGDGLGPGDAGYKFIKKIFTNPICKWLFKWVHPDMGVGIANYFSRKSRAKTGNADELFLGEDKEWLILYSKEKAKTMAVDFFIFGHRHYAIDLKINDKCRYINLGDWIRLNTYAVFDGTELQLLTWEA